MKFEVLLTIILDHLPGIVAAISGVWVLMRSKENRKLSKETRTLVEQGTEVSVRNEQAIKEVRHDLQNGVGEKIAAKAAEHIAPILQDAVGAVVQKADEVAVALAAKTASWDGVERRVGPVDRRGS